MFFSGGISVYDCYGFPCVLHFRLSILESNDRTSRYFDLAKLLSVGAVVSFDDHGTFVGTAVRQREKNDPKTAATGKPGEVCSFKG